MNPAESNRAQETARLIEVAFFDADGVIFPAWTIATESLVAKRWSYCDGQGISLLRAVGIHVVFITSEKDVGVGSIQYLVDRWNNFPSVKKDGGWSPVVLYTGRSGLGKIEAAEHFLNHVGHTFSESSYMGDDLVDVPLLRRVALPVAPAQGEAVVRNIAQFISVRNGGEGAVRDFANFVLASRGIDPTTLPTS